MARKQVLFIKAELVDLTFLRPKSKAVGRFLENVAVILESGTRTSKNKEQKETVYLILAIFTVCGTLVILASGRVMRLCKIKPKQNRIRRVSETKTSLKCCRKIVIKVTNVHTRSKCVSVYVL